MQVQNGYVDIIEQLSMVFDRVAAAEENDDFLAEVLLEKREQQQEALV